VFRRRWSFLGPSLSQWRILGNLGGHGGSDFVSQGTSTALWLRLLSSGILIALLGGEAAVVEFVLETYG